MIDRWDPAFTVDDATLDDHHRTLIERLHKLKETMNETTDIADVIKALDFIDEHIYRHFQYEENYMRAHDYPETAAHRVMHEEFTLAYDRMKERTLHGEKVGMREIILFLESWLETHFAVEDRKYAEYIAANPASHPGYEARNYHTEIHF